MAQASNAKKQKVDQSQRAESSHLRPSQDRPQPEPYPDIEGPQPEPYPDIEGLDDEHWPLSGRPFFSVILSKSHVKPVYHLSFPCRMRDKIPNAVVPLVIRYCGKEWRATYCGEGRQKNVTGGWKAFVTDNNLKIGDAVVFELLESSHRLVKVRVQILRGDLPAELQKKIDGSSYESAIPVD